jgi:hypothetical protein
VFVDETGSNLAMPWHYARSPQGSRAYNDAPHSARAEFNINWCNGATRTDRRSGLCLEPSNRLAFETYITQVLVPNLWAGACVVMDHLPAHKVTGIREAIEAVGARVIYLSPYSPDFSQARKLLV